MNTSFSKRTSLPPAPRHHTGMVSGPCPGHKPSPSGLVGGVRAITASTWADLALLFSSFASAVGGKRPGLFSCGFAAGHTPRRLPAAFDQGSHGGRTPQQVVPLSSLPRQAQRPSYLTRAAIAPMSVHVRQRALFQSRQKENEGEIRAASQQARERRPLARPDEYFSISDETSRPKRFFNIWRLSRRISVDKYS